jgi:hypothetical protein
MHRRSVEKTEVDMVVVLNFLEFGRGVVCDEDKVDQIIWGLGTCLGCVIMIRVMRRQLNINIRLIESHGKPGSLLANGDGHLMRES